MNLQNTEAGKNYTYCLNFNHLKSSIEKLLKELSKKVN